MEKVNQVRDKLKDMSIDAIYITKPSNVSYTSGYTDEAAYVLITKNNNYIITDARFIEECENTCKGFKVINWHNFDRSIAKTIKSLCKEENITSIAFEKNNLTYSEYSNIKNELDTESIAFTPSQDIIEELRYVKDENEIACIKRACEISDEALSELVPYIKVGVKEYELAARLEYFIKMKGAEIGFETILISGAKSSLLHGKPGDKVIENGDFLLIDFGVKYKGYISDTTRTFLVGSASDKQLEIYRLVKEAQQIGLDELKAGVHATTPDTKIREVVKEYEEYYYKGIGHGVGRDLHEEPFLGNYGTKTILKNCVITMEPGLYFPGWGGVRIEDTVLITEDGYEILTKYPKDLTILDSQI